ncbi:BTAD domain-containing putative transcriptional regulator [Actinosynnema sp. NPDC004786]
MVLFRVLGPLEAVGDRGPVDLKGPRHRAVLARLLVAKGRVVPVTRLIDDLWEGDAPDRAQGAVQTFVGALRKALEPDRPPRTPARLLVTVPPGYALRADEVDAWRFEAAVAGAARSLAEGRPGEVRTALGEALGLWRGPAYAEFADRPWARGEAARLDELRLLAVERRAEAALALGEAGESVPDLRDHVAAHPLREDGRRLLALALYRTGRQGEALATLRQARDMLRAELGVDPAPALRRLESAILAHDPALTAPAPAAPRPVDPASPATSPPAAGPPAAGSPATGLPAPASPAAPAQPVHPTSPATSPPAPTPPAVSPAAVPPAGGADPTAAGSPSAPPSAAAPSARTPVDAPAAAAAPSPVVPAVPPTSPAAPLDLPPAAPHPFVGRDAELAQLDQAAREARLVLVSGTAGVGKTALVRVFADRLAAAGWTTAWATCPEGAPTAWPWTRIQQTLAAAGHPPPPTPAARFERHRAIASYLAGIPHPVLLVFDDVHLADEDTLDLLTSLAHPDTGRLLVVATYRSTEITPALTAALARAARAEPARVYPGGLPEARVRELVETLTGREPTPADVRAIHGRSAGNPFFVRELTRLWEADPELRSVPAGVRDVLRHRLARLTDTARTHLRQASVLGRDVDLDVLVALAGDEDAVLDSVESALRAGFLVEPAPDRLRFAHALVQETLYEDIAHARRARWHAEAADVLERTRPDDVDALAHHLLRAGRRVADARTARYTRAAAERAERRFAPHQAAALWRETLDRSAPADRPAAVAGLVRALAVTGDLEQARRHRAEAIPEVEDDPVLTARTIGSFDVPALWTTNDDEALSARLVHAAERALRALPPGHDADRARLLVTIAMERRADPGRRGLAAALEAEAIARRLDDPPLLALALNGRFLQTCHRAGLAPDRARLGDELLDLSARHGLVTFEVLGHLIAVQARTALADLPAADRHAAAADALADRHDLPLVGVFTTWYAALRLAVTGRRAEAAAAYRAAASRLTGAGMPGVERGILPLALLSLGEVVPDADWGPYEPWARPITLLAQGKRAEALAAVVPDSPHDLLFEARTCLHAALAVEAGDRPTAARLYHALLPAADELAGAGSGLVSFGPTAHHLGTLAALLGRHDEAAAHHRRARELADRLGAPQWTPPRPAAPPPARS